MQKYRKGVEPPKAVQEAMDNPPSNCDPLGSWTGKPADPLEKPVQDADDL